MDIYTNTYRLINGIIYNSYMVRFTVNLEEMSRERAKSHGTFRWWQEI